MEITENTIVFQKEIESLHVSESCIVKPSDMKVRHYHDTIELFILTEGTRYFFVDRMIHVIRGGTAILIPPGQIHKTSTYGEDCKHRRFLLQFSREGAEAMISSVYATSFDEFCQRYNGPVSFRPEVWDQVLLSINRIKEEFGKDDPYLPQVRLQALELLSLYTKEKDHADHLEKENQEPLSLASGVHNSIQQVIEYLNDHYMDDILLDDLSKKFFISRGYLTRNFRQVTGVTIVQYLTVVRIRKACQLLKETSLNITEIAEQCGFSNTTYFENVFRRLRSMTPGQYRKKVTQQAEN